MTGTRTMYTITHRTYNIQDTNAWLAFVVHINIQYIKFVCAFRIYIESEQRQANGIGKAH